MPLHPIIQLFKLKRTSLWDCQEFLSLKAILTPGNAYTDNPTYSQTIPHRVPVVPSVQSTVAQYVSRMELLFRPSLSPGESGVKGVELTHVLAHIKKLL